MATGFISGTMAAFTDANPQKTLANVILQGKGVADHYSFTDGVKYITKIPLLVSATVDTSTGAIAGYNTGSGGVTINDITLQNKQIKIQEWYTNEQVTTYILNKLLKPGSNPENPIPLQDAILKLKGDAISLDKEKKLWRSVDSSTTLQASKLDYFDGILKQTIAVAGAYGNPTVAFTTFTSDASIRDHVKSVYTAMITKDAAYASIPTVMSLAPENFSALYAATFGLNSTINTLTIAKDGSGKVVPVDEFALPYASNCTVVSEKGLVGNNVVYLTRPENIQAVLDLQSEDETIDFWYNKAAHAWELDVFYKLGVKVVDASSSFVTSSATV